jgi:hypothetical protein
MNVGVIASIVDREANDNSRTATIITNFNDIKVEIKLNSVEKISTVKRKLLITKIKYIND